MFFCLFLSTFSVSRNSGDGTVNDGEKQYQERWIAKDFIALMEKYKNWQNFVLGIQTSENIRHWDEVDVICQNVWWKHRWKQECDNITEWITTTLEALAVAEVHGESIEGSDRDHNSPASIMRTEG